MFSEFHPCNISLSIHYFNSKKEYSKRIIDVKTYSTNPDGYFRAFCHSRRAIRSFKYANVCECVDTLTSEIIKPDNLLSYFNEVYNSNPERELDDFLSEHKPIIDIFTYIMQVDGYVDPRERNEILHWIFERSCLSEVFVKYCDGVIKKWEPPRNERQYLVTLQQINKLFPELLDDIYQYSKSIMVADKRIHLNEMEAIQQMERLFGLEES